MRPKDLIILTTLFGLAFSASPLFGQFSSTASHARPVSALPSTCKKSSGDIVFLTTGGSPGVYECTADNTYTRAGGAVATVTGVNGVQCSGTTTVECSTDTTIPTLAGNNVYTGWAQNTPSTAQVLVAGTTISPNASVVQVTCATDTTLTSTPNITTAGVNGGRFLRVVSNGAAKCILQDKGKLASSGLCLTAPRVVLDPVTNGARKSIDLYYDSTLSCWTEVGITPGVYTIASGVISGSTNTTSTTDHATVTIPKELINTAGDAVVCNVTGIKVGTNGIYTIGWVPGAGAAISNAQGAAVNLHMTSTMHVITGSTTVQYATIWANNQGGIIGEQYVDAATNLATTDLVLKLRGWLASGSDSFSMAWRCTVSRGTN